MAGWIRVWIVVRLLPVVIIAFGWLTSLGCARAIAQGAASAEARSRVDVDAAARLVVDGTNTFRGAQQRRSVRANAALTAAAAQFAGYMARSGRFGHTADGRQPAARAEAQGYAYCIVAENIAEYGAPELDTGELAAALLQGWEGSPAHRANLLNTDVTDVGVGIARTRATGSYVAVQMFGLPKSAAISFSLANRTKAAVSYRLDGGSWTLPAAAVRTHRTCGAATVELITPGAKPHPIQRGEQLAVVRAPNGMLEIRPASP